MTHILIADPDPAACRALSLLLQCKVGAEKVCEVTDIENLDRQLLDCAPDILLLAHNLDGSPAPQVCQRLMSAYPDLKIILTSINPDDILLAKAHRCGFIYKGGSADYVLATIQPYIVPSTELKGKTS